MKKFVLPLFFLFVFSLFSQEIEFGKIDTATVSDGPYIFIQEQNIVVNFLTDGKAYQKIFPGITSEERELSIPELNFQQNILFNFPPAQDVFSDVSNFFVVSDIHGQLEQLLKILKNNQIIDRNNNWIWKNGHLIITGDVFDRGPSVTECLWLIYKWEKQARQDGGNVHFLLGNHELMIFQRDLRYLHEKYDYVCSKLDKTFDQLFSPNSVLGAWLRSKPVIIKIDNFLFCHAGISPLAADVFSDFHSINDYIYQKVNSSKLEDDNDIDNIIFHSNGPFWYRGYFQASRKYELITEIEIDSILTRFQVDKIIVGHTTQDSVLSLWNGKIIAVDSGIKYGNKGEGLLFRNEVFFRAKAEGSPEKLTTD